MRMTIVQHEQVDLLMSAYMCNEWHISPNKDEFGKHRILDNCSHTGSNSRDKDQSICIGIYIEREGTKRRDVALRVTLLMA